MCTVQYSRNECLGRKIRGGRREREEKKIIIRRWYVQCLPHSIHFV